MDHVRSQNLYLILKTPLWGNRTYSPPFTDELTENCRAEEPAPTLPAAILTPAPARNSQAVTPLQYNKGEQFNDICWANL